MVEHQLWVDGNSKRDEHVELMAVTMGWLTYYFL